MELEKSEKSKSEKKEITIALNAQAAKKFIFKYIDILLLLAIIYLAIYVRWSTADVKIPLDYDPWWFFRHSQEILENGLQPLKWDIQSFYPPGRPVDFQLGWDYMIAISYLAISFFAKMDFTRWAIIAPTLAAAAAAIPAYLTGRLITNRWGGLVTAFFATLTPAFIGVSMAGYLDSDAIVVFLSFFSAFGILYALKKKSIFSYAVAVFSLWLFAVTWNQPWYILLLFFLFVPFYWIFQVAEGLWYEGKRNLSSLLVEKLMLVVKNFLKPLLIISVAATAVTLATGFLGIPVYDPITTLVNGLSFLGGQLLIVNISVAELQVVNIFTKEGVNAIASRLGAIGDLFGLIISPPLILGVFGLIGIIGLKFWKKVKISVAEVFTVLWFLVTFALILRGIRFSELFSIAIAAGAGFVVGNIVHHLKPNKEIFGRSVPTVVIASVYGLLIMGFVAYASNSILVGASGVGMEVSQNWIDAFEYLKKNVDQDSLIVTWWDPGHIIAGYTGLKVMADGAHCAPGTCIPYDHNIRIQDTGRMFSTSSENESVTILKKYKALTPEQCAEAREKYKDIIPADACKPVTEMYVIASSDLIGKYHWMSYFGSGGNAKDFFQLPLSNYDPAQGLSYADGMVMLVGKGNQLVPVYNNRYVIKQIVYYQNGEEKREDFSNTTNPVDGLLWVDPSFQTVIFMQPEVRDSVFTQMFFWNGAGLQHFQQVFSNSEVKIFKVVW